MTTKHPHGPWIVHVKGKAQEDSAEIAVLREGNQHGQDSMGWFDQRDKILIASSGGPCHNRYIQSVWDKLLDVAQQTADELNAKDSAHVCSACARRVKDWNGSDPKCAFVTGSFSPDNWSCATLGQLRDLLALEIHNIEIPGIIFTRTQGDQRYAVLDLYDVDALRNDISPMPVSLYVGWYKGRGKTENLMLIFDQMPARPPTEAEVLAIINHFKEQQDGNTIR